MEVIQGGVTAAQGFEAAGAAAGIKYLNRLDMALVYSTQRCLVAGTFTRNVVKAAPVVWDREIVDHSDFVQAVVVNAGVANACTGKHGMEYCRETAAAAAAALGIPQNAVLIGSTGVIGMQLPMDRVLEGVGKLTAVKNGSLEAGTMAAQAIMTTDTISKEVSVKLEIGGKTVVLGGMCKGSGMIHPDMCTMLGFVTTDLAISKELLQEALSGDVEDTFNMISVDGDTSTNDTLLLLANGLAGNQEITEKNEDYWKFTKALNYINTALAKMMAGDGEGATALFEAKVIHGENREQAKMIAKAVICSSLTKAAIFGHDANWGRILCAMGYSGAQFDPEAVELFFESAEGRIAIYKDGQAVDYSEQDASRILSAPEVTVLIDMKCKDGEAAAWGCDLTYDYVKINADYRS